MNIKRLIILKKLKKKNGKYSVSYGFVFIDYGKEGIENVEK